jgi:hypothetical protein
VKPEAIRQHNSTKLHHVQVNSASKKELAVFSGIFPRKKGLSRLLSVERSGSFNQKINPDLHNIVKSEADFF